jgi:hypothetical protein
MTAEEAGDEPPQPAAAAVTEEQLPQAVSSATVPPPAPVLAPTTPEQDEARAMARAQILHDHRKWLLGIGFDTSSSFDKMLTTLSAGALGLSVSFGQGKNVWPLVLKLSWACFTASLLAMLFSFRTARREVDRKVDEVDSMLRRGDEEKPADDQGRRYEVTTYALNNTALVFLIVGICLLIAFAAMNV